MIRIVPIILGVLGSCFIAVLIAVLFGETIVGADGAEYITIGGIENLRLFSVASVNAIVDAPWVGLPFKMSDTVFSLLGNADSKLIITSIITIVPISIATIVEHIGDISAISSTVDRNFIKDPGIHRTLIGDGVATIVASLFGAPANTTYGENTGVLSLSKVYDPVVIRIAAVFAMIFSFSPKIAACISAIPTPVMGGISLVLYGMISAVGVRNIVENQVDFNKSRNVIIAAIILVLSIGITYSSAGSITFAVGGMRISLSGLAVGSLAGIILNAILPGKDFVFNKDSEDEKDIDSKATEKDIQEG